MSSNLNQPIRVAELSDPVYVPKVPVRAMPPSSPPSKLSLHTDLLDESNARYAWNKRTDSQKMNTSAVTTETQPQPSIAAVIQSKSQVRSPIVPDAFAQSVTTQVLGASIASSLEGSLPNAIRTTPSRIDDARGFEELCELIEHTPIDSVSMPQVPVCSHVWGIGYHAVTMDGAIDYLEQVILARQNAYAVTSNLNYSMLCERHPRLKAFTKRASLVLCDGMPALWRSKWNANKLPERVTGSDLIYRLCERSAQKRFKVYFYGAAEGIADRAAAKLKQLYPNLQVAGVQCPSFQASSAEQIEYQIARIRAAKPDVLFVALGQPKGEYWIEDHLAELGVPLSIQVGASFDFVAGNSIRAPKLMQLAGLEWLYRTVKDPYRLAPRYFQNLMYLVGVMRKECIEGLDHRHD